MLTTVHADHRTLWTGLRWVAGHTRQPILCILKGRVLKLAFMGGTRLAVSWYARRQEGETGDAFFVLPPEAIEDLLAMSPTGPVALRLEANRVELVGARATPEDGYRWLSDPAQLSAPPQFGQMLLPPPDLVRVHYIALADALHRSVVCLAEKDANEAVHRSKLAILVSQQHGQFTIDGTAIARSQPPDRLYFDPRLLMRSLEYISAETVGLGIRRLVPDNRGILYLLSAEEAGTVCCGLLSIGLDTQRLYPLPPRES